MRIAFIGGHGHHYLKNLLPNPELKIAVASDGFDEEAAQNLRAKVRGESRWFDSPDDLWREFRPDIVSIGAVYAHNGTLAAKFLERDVAVICDKPLAANWSQLERLRELTRDNSRKVLTEFPFRCRPAFRTARHAVQSGSIGEVVLATVQKSYRFEAQRPAWYGNPNQYPGTLFWVASHGVDALHFCGGVPFSPLVSASGNLSQPAFGAALQDHVVALFALKNGGHGLVHADFLRPEGAPTHGDDRLRIAGTRGLVEVQNGRCRLTTREGERDITEEIRVRPIEEEFLAAIRGEESVYSTQESLLVAELLLRAQDAMRQSALR